MDVAERRLEPSMMVSLPLYGYCMGERHNKVIREMFKLSDEGALKEISKLVHLGV